MEDLLRARIVDALRPVVPRAADVVAAPNQCWGDIAVALEDGELTESEMTALLDILVAIRDRNALLLFASIFGVEELARRAPDLPADLQVWCVAEGHSAEGLGAAAQGIAGDEEYRARERAIFRAAARGLRGTPVPGGRMIVGGRERGGPAAVHCAFFQNRKRPGAQVSEVVLHETVTRSHADTLAVLKKQGLGVHLIVDEHGAVHQHGNLQDDLLWHASEHNGPSVGIEVVNPYEPRFLPKGSAWTTVIRAPWAAGGWYVVPTAAQAEATTELVAWLTSPESTLPIPRGWPGIAAGKLSLTRIPDRTLRPGIWAHTYFAHADGGWLALYAWLRLEAALAPAEAYSEALALATGVAGAVTLAPYTKDR